MNLEITALPIPGAYEVKSRIFRDHRGEFARLFCAKELAEIQGDRPIVQINHSLTRAVGAVRGLHFQHPPAAEAKWVRCLSGRVFDVMVDLRRGSPTFLSWHAVELSAAAANAVFIPEGCAHGFQVLQPESMLLYLHSAPYAPEHEGGVRWDDPRIGIDWPMPVKDISERDRNHPLLAVDFEGIEA